ncbi:MAG: Rrf2 family transcriptional regulator [Siculibacillus sp.]|nr:Rrf2 family transcriptional regulator [Siculibacillus sp.]
MRMNAATNGAFRILMICRRDRQLSMQEMAARLGLSEALVLKSCHELMQAGLLVGKRGRGGGYRLARDPEGIRITEIVDVFEPEENLFPCRLRADGECRIVEVCKLRRACERAYGVFRSELDRLTIADLALEDEGV